MGEGAGKPPLPPPTTDGGDKGGNDRACAGGHRREQPGRTGARKGYPKASPLGARHARPSFPPGPLPKQLSSERPKTLGPAEPLMTQLRSPRIPAQKLRGCWRRGSRRGPPAPSPRARSPTHPVRPLRADSRSPEPAAGGNGARGGGPRSAGRSVAEPAHLGRQLLAPVDPSAREGFDSRHNPA